MDRLNRWYSISTMVPDYKSSIPTLEKMRAWRKSCPVSCHRTVHPMKDTNFHFPPLWYHSPKILTPPSSNKGYIVKKILNPAHLPNHPLSPDRWSWYVFLLHAYIYVTGSAKTQHNSAFFQFLFINLLCQVYLLEKFQSYVPITFRVTALQSSNNRRINCTASIGKINYRCLPK